MKKTVAKRLMAVAMTVCMVLAMVAVPASALTTYNLELEITEALESVKHSTGQPSKITVLAKSADVSLEADLTTELVALLVSKFEGDAKDNKSGLWDFESDEMGLTIERGLAANRKGQTEWFAWLDTFAAKDTIESGSVGNDDKSSLVALLKETKKVKDMTQGKDYVLTYAPVENLQPGDPAIGNTYTFTMRLNKIVSGGGGGSVVKEYAITVSSVTNGTAKADATRAEAGDKVTVTVTADEGYEVDTVKVTQGTKDVAVTDNGDGTYSFAMPAGAVTVTVTTKAKPVVPVDPYDPSAPGHSSTCWAAKYSDVDLNAWYHKAVCYVLGKGLMSGYNATTFGPNDTLSRAMVAQIFYNLEGKPAGEYENPFPDVEEGMWYHDAITWAYANTVVAGYGDGLYRPNKDVSREELVQIFYNYAKARGCADAELADLSSFADDQDVAPWHEVAVQWGVGARLMSGKGGNLIAPRHNATRAEAAQMLMNFCENIKK